MEVLQPLEGWMGKEGRADRPTERPLELESQQKQEQEQEQERGKKGLSFVPPSFFLSFCFDVSLSSSSSLTAV